MAFHWSEIRPETGGKYELNVERRHNRYALDLPVAPAVVVEGEIIVEGKNISDPRVALRSHFDRSG